MAGRARDVFLARQNRIPEQQASERDAFRRGRIVSRRRRFRRKGRQATPAPLCSSVPPSPGFPPGNPAREARTPELFAGSVGASVRATARFAWDLHCCWELHSWTRLGLYSASIYAKSLRRFGCHAFFTLAPDLLPRVRPRVRNGRHSFVAHSSSAVYTFLRPLSFHREDADEPPSRVRRRFPALPGKSDLYEEQR